LNVADISVLTAVTRPEYLDGLYRSIAAQDVDWEWHVQLDGAALGWQPSPAVPWANDERVNLRRNPRTLGSGVTRNQALMHAIGESVICVDDDDLLVPGALTQLSTALAKHRECFGAWGATRSFTNDPSDSEPFKQWIGPGVIAAGTVLDAFESNGHFPVHVGAMLWRRSHLLGVGGYAALPRSIDTNPFLACESLFPHYYVDQPVYLYRQHAQQMTRDEDYQASRTLVHRLNFERARALQRLLRPSLASDGSAPQV
jgi:glycosyltransferase involved in cell wall biosynthesis